MTLLSGKAAVVTGAGGGIGRAIATAFGAAGAAVMCLDINPKTAEETAQMISRAGGRALARACDVSLENDTRDAADAAQQSFGAVQILVHAAAADDPNGTVLEISPDDWTRVFAVNVMGGYLMSRAVLPMMIAAGGGSIILIASQLGRVAAPSRAPPIAPRKAQSSSLRRRWRWTTPSRTSVSMPCRRAQSRRGAILRFGDMETARRKSGPKHLLNRLVHPEKSPRRLCSLPAMHRVS
jgi:NAD(P)-dependent dehydrogenase (short-subunit alcohol dehydrogenase family)